MSIYVSGSLAFDRIMTFGGNFQDHVLMDKLHMLNVSFMVDSMEERRGGCGGNIAYTLALLGERPVLISAAGRDFAQYACHLQRVGLSLEGVRINENKFTAQCYITTDLRGNQISGFYPGAMSDPSTYSFHQLSNSDIAIVSPGNMEDMQRFPALYREKGVRYIFDPGQQLPLFTAGMLELAINGAFAYVCNDYEIGMTCKTLGRTEEELLDFCQWLVITMGEKGARILGRKGRRVEISAACCRSVVDPTGAGDAHRAGLLLGLSHGLEIPQAARLGAAAASFAIECMGTQEHFFTKQDFVQRYVSCFGEMPFAL